MNLTTLRLISAAALIACSACAPRPSSLEQPAPRLDAVVVVADTGGWKDFEFAILEDYDKGESLGEVARDFQLFRELGVTIWRGSFGWDDYEPRPGEFDLEWLHRFAELANTHGIRLRPYLGYTPEWAAVGRRDDGEVWNDPPRRLDDWSRFARTMALELRRHPNVLSFEIYNEENVPLWWDGTVAEYAAVVASGAAAIDSLIPDATVLMGGMVWPDAEWVEAVCTTGRNAARIDVIPFHAYPETWTPESVRVENYLGPGYTTEFLPAVDASCGPKPIWINELGFATTRGRTERDQALWWARAIATFAAAPRVEHLGIYEIKDLRPGSAVIGDPENLHLGLTNADRSKKLAFSTVKLLVRLLGSRIAVRDAQAVVRDASDTGAVSVARVHRHLFERPDGALVLVAWIPAGGEPMTVKIELPRAADAMTEYALNGSPSTFTGIDGRMMLDLELRPDQVRIFEVPPSSQPRR